MNSVRRWVGFISLMAGLMAFISLYVRHPAVSEPSVGLVLFSFLFIAWYLSGMVTFLGMMLDQGRVNLGGLSVVFFCIMIFFGLPTSSGGQVSDIDYVLMCVIVLYLPMVQALETVYYFTRKIFGWSFFPSYHPHPFVNLSGTINDACQILLVSILHI